MSSARVGVESFSSPASAGLHLVCVPYACGSANAFRDWAGRLPSWLRVSAVELPGRGRRILEQPFSAWDDLTGSIVGSLAAVGGEPLVLFGHSMGALVAYEVARRLTGVGRPPCLLVTSGSRPPDRARLDLDPREFSDAALFDKLADLGGLPAPIAGDPDLRDLLLPGLRADFGLLSDYRSEAAEPLAVPVVALGGRSDPIAPAKAISGWERYSSERGTTKLVDGDHFFLHTSPGPFFSALVPELVGALDALAVDASEAASPGIGGWWQ